MTKKRFLYILNPISGDGVDREEVLDILSNNLYGIEITVWETTGSPDDPKEIQQMLKEKQWDGLLVGGGDGTIKMVVTAILGAQLPLGIIPLGSANGLATGFGIHGVSDACYAVQKGKVEAVDLWDINGELCIHLSDFGFNAGLVKKSTALQHRGMLAYAKSSLEQLKEMRQYTFVIKADGIEEKVKAKSLVVANGNKYGTGAVINPTGNVGDGKFEVVTLDPEGLEEIIGLSLAMFNDRLGEVAHVKTRSFDKAEIENPEGADFQIDGEVMPQTDQIKIEAMPHKVNFYCLV
ncbi:diacylglycerol kinase [Echinicola strongylocentroti]|uniref:Diacylglycerol kinase n=1 Tax=Echinicola strongylocentroti TaxID=1795355 RepID=A0A2Z4ILD2_9BACT|nr:diacylglycerol kinase family protein [Echinicola strongylocentroti]AWW31694.1 diacylglycerol kinase [Echinicola strongylocentroti]